MEGVNRQMWVNQLDYLIGSDWVSVRMIVESLPVHPTSGTVRRYLNSLANDGVLERAFRFDGETLVLCFRRASA